MCSNGELNTSRAKLRGANYPRESQRQGGSLDRTAKLQACKVIINRNANDSKMFT